MPSRRAFRFYFIVLYVITMLLTCKNSYAQEHGNYADSISNTIEKLDSTASSYTSQMYNVASRHSFKPVESLFALPRDTTDTFDRELSLIEAQKNVLRGDLGFNIDASYLENFKAGFFDVEGIFYRRRAKVGLEWNILKNGLLENHYELNELEKQEQTTLGLAQDFIPDSYFQTLQNRIAYSFNKRKISLLQSYLNLLNRQEEIYIALYHQEYLTWDDILEVTSKKARVDRLLKSNQHLNDEFKSHSINIVNVQNLPVVEVNLRMFVDAALNQSASNAKQKAASVAEYHPLNDISLSASLDYNFYSNAPEEQLSNSTGQREFVSVGINVSIPLPLQVKDKSDLAEAKRRRIETDVASLRQGRRQKAYGMYENYQNILAEYERDYESYKILNEKVRMLLVKKKLGDPGYSPRELIEIVDDRFDKALELIDHHRQIYEKLLEMYAATYQSSMQDYITPYTFDHQIHRQEEQSSIIPQYKKSIYIWSTTFEKYSNGGLLDYLKKQQFDTIFLSPGTEPDIAKFKAFLKEAHKLGISVEWMVGNNNLLFKDHEEDVLSIINLAKQAGADGIHLDVEPQTFDDWEEKKDHYKTRYLNMVKSAAKAAHQKGITLSVSVPFYFDTIIEPIHGFADSIQLMAYGTIDLNQLKERIHDESTLAPDKVAVALRPQDFKDQAVFESFLAELKRELTFNRFSVHDLEALLKFKGNMINEEQ